MAGRRTVRLADPRAHETVAGSPCKRGDEVKTHSLPFMTVAPSRTLPPDAGSEVTLALKCLTAGWLVAGAALAGRPAANRHSEALATAMMLRPRRLFMLDIFQVWGL